MRKHNAYWFHDGNPARPYALLTGGKISNFYADCTPVVSRPSLCSKAVRDIIELAPIELGTTRHRLIGFCGSAYGAITLAYELTRNVVLPQAWYTAKGSERGEMVLDRFNFDLEHDLVALAEDVITEFTTSRGTIRAIEKKIAESGIGGILPYVFCIVNRSGQREIDDYQIIALVNEDRAKTWVPGHNPFTPDGKELVEPVRPKQNWSLLTRAYS